MRSTTILSFVILAGLLFSTADGHGSMMKPYGWSDAGGTWFPGRENPCLIITPLSARTFTTGLVDLADLMSSPERFVDVINNSPVDITKTCDWFSNYTHIPGDRTISPTARSYPQLEELGDGMYDKNPWMSPGAAPVFSPCGALGGNPLGAVGSSDLIFPNLGWSYGPLAQDYYMSPGFTDVVTTEWKAGSVVEAAWAMAANHGGGYSYRLCKAPEEGMGRLTEECFQQGHLEFFGDKQWIDLGEDRIEIEAVRTREGTFPEGSQWTRNPIPNCAWPQLVLEGDPDSLTNGDGYRAPDYPIPDISSDGYQFPPPAPGLSGFFNV